MEPGIWRCQCEFPSSIRALPALPRGWSCDRRQTTTPLISLGVPESRASLARAPREWPRRACRLFPAGTLRQPEHEAVCPKRPGPRPTNRSEGGS